ncbi:hypothetical protein G6F58_013180 [Rhizopus delemar]|nr:hypothetical protein G6F58_013180 [Rhizopus delemar]
MCQYSAEDGRASDWHAMHLGNLAQSGAGLLILEATAVEPRGRISWADLGLWDDGAAAALAQVLTSVRRWSPMPLGIQLGHAGRKASVRRPWDGGGQLPADDARGWATVAPSPLPSHRPAIAARPCWPVPRSAPCPTSTPCGWASLRPTRCGRAPV